MDINSVLHQDVETNREKELGENGNIPGTGEGEGVESIEMHKEQREEREIEHKENQKRRRERREESGRVE